MISNSHFEADAIESGYHETLMKDPETGKIVRKRTITEKTADSIDVNNEKTENNDERTADA